MKDRILLKTNVMVCLVIVIGFFLTAVLSYRSNFSAALENIEQVSDLTSEGIYYQMTNILSKPVNVSLTMANDSLLKTLLFEEPQQLDNAAYTDTIAQYLQAYQSKYGYDSVFLVSAATSRYYNFSGLDRVLERGDPENVWYYDGLLPSQAEFAMNVDNDEVAQADNAITLFVNCKIKDDDGALMGVVGVGVRIDQLQSILRSYRDDFGVTAYFVNDNGTIELSTEHTGYEQVSLFDVDGGTDDARREILNWKTDGSPLNFWDLDSAGQRRNYVVTRYLPEIGWHLVVERDTQALVAKLNRQLSLTVVVILAIVGIILVIITRVIRNFNLRIVTLTKTYEQQRKTMFEKATEQLFEDIYELDVTHNCPANQATEAYFESLGAPSGTPFDEALAIIAKKQIKPEFQEGYLKTFSPQNVQKAFQSGKDSLHYDLMIAEKGQDYYWMRITAQLILSEGDGSLHMLVYRQNIDAQKRREQQMQELARTDEMTGLLNKATIQRRVMELLQENPKQKYAYYIFDIDHFKDANDRFGHAFGDTVIRQFAEIIRSNFRKSDVIGRIGGDEFAAFLPVADTSWVAQKASALSVALDREIEEGSARWHMSASIGVAIAPGDGMDFDTLYQRADAALYETKKRGRGSFTLYSDLSGAGEAGQSSQLTSEEPFTPAGNREGENPNGNRQKEEMN